MTYIKSFFGRITKDFAQHQLLPLKILFFVHSSTIAVLYPYLTIHMRELGINVEETAIMSSLIPIVAIIMPPLAGMIADKIGNFKLLLALSSVTGGSAALLLLLVPVGRISIIFPPRVEMTIGCPAEDISMLKMDVNQFSCHPAHPYAYNVEMRLEACGFVCDWDEESGKNGSFPLDEAVSYAVNVQNSIEGEAEVFRYPLGSHDRPMSMDTIYKTMARNLTNNVRYKTALRRLSKTSLFFPTEGMYDFDCRFSTENSTDVYCEFGSNETSEEKLISSKTSLIPFVSSLTPIKTKSGEYVISLSNKPNMNMLKQFDINSFAPKKSNKAEDYGDFSKATCNDNFARDNEGVFVEIIFQQQGDKAVADPVGTTVILEECRPKCLLTAPRHQLCSNAKEATDLDAKLTFWSYLAVRVFIGIIGGTAFAMFEGAVIAILREHKADYGLQRIYGILGSMIASPLSGYLIDYCSRGKGYTDFRPAFYLYAVLKIIGGILMLTINLEFKAPASDLLKDVVKVLKNVEIVALFVAVFVLGTAWGYIESFLFWLLQDLGANSSLMGITITVGGFAGIPLLVLSGPIIDRIGHANVLFIGFIFYAIRLMGYSLIYNPWMCLLFEALEGVTTSLAFTAAVTYTARLSTTTTDTSIQGFMGGLYYGVGKGSGSLIGGYLMKAFGTRPTYQIFAGASLITGCVYFLFNKLYLRKLPQKEMNDICKKAPKVADVESCEKNGTLKSKNEKKPLKDYKGNINLYSENDQHKNSKDGSMLNYQSSEKFENGKSKGIDNPVFENNESSDGCKKQRSGSATDTKGLDYYK